MKIADGSLRINATDTLIPRKVQHLNATLSLSYSERNQRVKLSDFSLLTKSPDLQLEQLAFKISRTNDAIQLMDFYLKTAHNQLSGKADYSERSRMNATASLKSGPLQLDEFKFFLPDLKLPVNPVLTLDGSIIQDSLHATVELADQEQKIQIELSSDNFIGFILNNQEDSMIRYWAKTKLKNIDLAHWSGNPGLNYFINGELITQGKGFDPETAEISMDGDFEDCLIEDKPVDKLHLSMNLGDGILSGGAAGQGNFGSFWLKSKLTNLQETPTYQLELKTQKLDLAQLTGNDSLQSNINLQANLTGNGFDPKTLSAKGTATMSKSTINRLKLDTLLAQVRYQNEDLMIDSMSVKTQNVDFKGSGNYSLKDNSDLKIAAQFTGIDELNAFLPVSNLKTSGSLGGRLWGTADSLNLESTLKLHETHYEDYILNRVVVHASGKMTSKDTIFHAHVLAQEFQSQPINLDSVVFDLDYMPDSIFVDGQLGKNDLSSRFQAGFHMGKTMRLTLPQWEIAYKNQHWALQQTPAVLEIDSLNYRIDHFKLASDNLDSVQFITAEGQVSRAGNNDFQLNATNINLQQLVDMFNTDVQASGMLSVNLALKGAADSIAITGDFGIDKAVFNGYSFSEFGGSLHSGEHRMAIQAQIVPRDSGQVELTGSVPFELAMDSLQFNMDTKDSLDLKLTVTKFPLAVLQSFNLTDEITGFLNGDITVKGTVESPDPTGNLRMKNASVKAERYGVDYRDILFSMDFLRDKMQLDTFRIKTADGDLTADGQIDFNSDFYKGDISQSQINLKFHHFNPVDHRRFNMQVDGTASLGGKKGDVVFDGDLTIPQSEFYMPAIYNLMGKVDAPEIRKPILVQAMEEQSASKNTVPSDSIRVAATDSISWSYFDQLKGKLKINIPKNTWIKDEDMRIEISGDLELMKHQSFFELFGTVDVVRGQYDLFGRTFIINDGSLSFQGGEEMMPNLNINATYSFRNTQRVEQKLSVNIRGTAEEPSVQFNLDGSAISEGDALSYILFGKSMNELTMNQQENVSGAGNLASNAAASILSSQLTGYLGKKLNVDYIEVKGSGDFNNATVVVGKYITNDLFVSYEQRFGETDEKNMAKYEVKLEYELFRSLFFQLNNSSNDSGFDMIFKFNSK